MVSISEIVSNRPLSLRPVEGVTLEQITHQWDAIACLRHDQLRDGIDVSMDSVIVPAVLLACRRTARASNVLDLGCGTGHLSVRLAKRFATVTGIDPSKRSIELARDDSSGIEFQVGSAESNSLELNSFDLIVANMVLMDTPNLLTTVAGIGRLLRPGGKVVFTITHPDFWPFYWGYVHEDWFRFDSEVAIEATFRISNAVSELRTTHFHRPLTAYFSQFCSNGFVFESFQELWPSRRAQSRYEAEWKFPRFLICTATLTH